jgi:hypothetical protein
MAGTSAVARASSPPAARQRRWVSSQRCRERVGTAGQYRPCNWGTGRAASGRKSGQSRVLLVGTVGAVWVVVGRIKGSALPNSPDRRVGHQHPAEPGCAAGVDYRAQDTGGQGVGGALGPPHGSRRTAPARAGANTDPTSPAPRALRRRPRRSADERRRIEFAIRRTAAGWPSWRQPSRRRCRLGVRSTSTSSDLYEIVSL